jgi:hypothetical protein
MRTTILSLFVVLGACYDPYAYPPQYPPPAQAQYQQQPPPQPQYQAAPVEGQVEGQVVGQAPPPLQAENIPPPPYDGAVWCEGYWSWTGASYAWVAGRYMAPPQAGVYWYPGGWVAQAGGYAFVAGRWAAPGWRHSHRFVYGPRAYYHGPRWRGRRWR